MITRRHRKTRRHVTTPEVNLTSLIDTALTLLVIFMVATPMVHHMIKVELPSGKSNESGASSQDITVYLDKNGTIFVDGQKVDYQQLFDVLQKKIGMRVDQVVVVKADQENNFGTVLSLVDKIKYLGGVKYVAFAMQKSATTRP